tara:strand:- start:68 stop:262 length:195 start_codon:yes stop_codon:yes gene_type:complete
MNFQEKLHLESMAWLQNMVKKKAKETPKSTSNKKAESKKNNSSADTEDAKALAEKIFKNLKKPH